MMKILTDLPDRKGCPSEGGSWCTPASHVSKHSTKMHYVPAERVN